MKKTLKFLLSAAFALALMLALGTAAFAATADDGLPLEYVSYGVGLPDPAAVDMHELGEDDITLDGVTYHVRTADGRIYIRLADLAAAKLLREGADKAAELGLDYAQLYISDGVILIKEDGLAEEELKELKAKLNELTYSVRVGVSTGDIFDLGNGAAVKMHVQIAEFAFSSGEANTAAKPERGLDVKASDCLYTDSMEAFMPIDRPETSTVYFYYYGTTHYSLHEEWDSTEEKLPEEEESREAYQDYSMSIGLAYSEKDIADGITYYIWISNENGDGSKISIYLPNDPYRKTNSGDFEAEDISGNSPNLARGQDKLAYLSEFGNGKHLPTVVITTDAEGKNVVKTITFENVTPPKDEFIETDPETGYTSYTDDPPSGYTKDEETDCFEADEHISAPDDAAYTDDVVLKVQDDIENPNRPM